MGDHDNIRQYNPVMRAYVRGYQPKPATDIDYSRRPIQTHDVQFSIQPEWKLGSRELAEVDCRTLNDMQVHPLIQPLHTCHFEVEEIEPGLFGIVCTTHPEPA